MRFHDVTVIGQVCIVSASFVLERLYWGCKVYLTLEEFLARDLVKFLRRPSIIIHLLIGIFLARRNILSSTKLHANFVAAI